MDPNATEAVALLLAERACGRLLHEYAFIVDSGRASRVAELFADDGVWLGADGRVRSGRKEIHAAFSQRQALQRRQSRRVISNVRIDVHSAGQASATAYLVNDRHDTRGSRAEHPAPVDRPKFVGDYRAGFRLVGQEWRIASLHFNLALLRPHRGRGREP